MRALVVICTCLVALPLYAHSIKLRDGRVVYGKIVGQSRESLTMVVRGRRMVFNKANIREISYSNRRPRVRKRPRRTRGVRRRAGKSVAARRARVAKEPTRVPRLERYNRWRIAARSAALPGWGQYDMGDRTTGLVLGGSFAALAAYTLDLRAGALAGKAAYRSEATTIYATAQVASTTAAKANPTAFLATNGVEYLVSASLLQEPAFGAYQSRLERYNNALALAALVYLGQIAHAWWRGGEVHGQPRPTGAARAGRGATAQGVALYGYYDRERLILGLNARF